MSWHDGHVRVDIFYRDMSPRKKAWVDLLGTVFLLLPVMIFTIAASLGYVAKSWAIFEGSPDAGGIHGVFLLKTLIPLFAGLMIVQGLVEILRNALIISGRLDPSTKDHDAADEERL
ncbi:TRAP transporter small permease subunit [Halomonas binhaiensis]|uniref:TRAP transporter small permease subunit n=1 Tax=Halomonas binhaiensis TaxID=2562282 RepID=UPI001F08879E|nr:TRAP transporter small permease subunit [Halomonas binhaiensis]